MEVRGLFHIHSSFSHDASLKPERIREILKTKGYAFGIICDHQKDLNEAGYRELQDRCRRLSNSGFILIPGLEFEFGAVHILGIGVSHYFAPPSIRECIGRVKAAGGLAIWAHPHPGIADLTADIMKELNGVEVWSARYGTKYAPSAALCRLVRKINGEFSRVSAYAGLDAHREDQFQDLFLRLELRDLSEGSILAGLKTGSYSMGYGRMTVPSRGYLTPGQRVIFPAVVYGYRCLDQIVDMFKGFRDNKFNRKQH